MFIAAGFNLISAQILSLLLVGRVRHVQRNERGAGFRGSAVTDARKLVLGGGATEKDVEALQGIDVINEALMMS